MHISWFGLSAFKIISKDTTLFTDPFGKSAGLTPPRGAGHIVVSSNPDDELYNNFTAISGDPFIVDGPGEYDVKGIFIRGIPITGKKNQEPKDEKRIIINRQAIYVLTIETVNIAFLGGLNQTSLNESQVEELNDVDVVLVPVGGSSTCDAEAAVEIVNQIEPKIIIPMHYKIPGLAVKMDALDRFLKEMGGKSEVMDKLLLKKTDLEEEKTQLVVLSPQRS